MNLLTIKKFSEALSPRIDRYKVAYTFFPTLEEYNTIINEIMKETVAQSIHKQTFDVNTYGVTYTYKEVTFILVRP